MTTRAEADAASHSLREDQWVLRVLLQADEARATPKDLLLVEKMRAAKTADDYAAFLVRADVIAMFNRQVAYFVVPA